MLSAAPDTGAVWFASESFGAVFEFRDCVSEFIEIRAMASSTLSNFPFIALTSDLRFETSFSIDATRRSSISKAVSLSFRDSRPGGPMSRTMSDKGQNELSGSLSARLSVYSPNFVVIASAPRTTVESRYLALDGGRPV